MWDDLSFSASSWDGRSFGLSWGLTWEAQQDELEYHGGGKVARREGGEDRTRLFREHHGYLDDLRSIQAQITDAARSARAVSIPDGARVPDAILPPTMRGTVPPTRVADVLGNPLILATLALLIDEADD